MHLRARLGLTATLLSLLAACGGGGGSGGPATPPPPTAPTSEDLANASAAQLKMTVRADTKYLTISWKDTFPSESGYRVEARAANGAWQTIASAPAGNGTGGPFVIGRVIDSAMTYRVSAVMSGYTVPLQTAAGQSEVSVALWTRDAFVTAGPLNIALQGRFRPGFVYDYDDRNIAARSFYIGSDALDIASSASLPQDIWDTTTVPDGPYELLGVVQLTSGLFVEARRDVVVDNPEDLAASLKVARVAGSLTDFNLTARATSHAGIRSVDFFIDNNLVQTLPGEPDNTYTFVASSLAAGTHTFRVVATDNDNATTEATRESSGDNPPILALASPLPDRIVTDTLHIEGTFADEQPGANLNVALGDVTILQTSTAGAFSIDRSLTGVAPGEYTLTARVIDSQGHHTLDTRNVIVESGQTGAELIAADVKTILDVDQGAVLYRKLDGAVILRNGSGAEVTLQTPADIAYRERFDLSSGYVAASFAADDSELHVYVFAPDGQATNISQPFGTTDNEEPQLSYPWVSWNSGRDSHQEIYNLVTQTRTIVPTGTGFTAITDSALITTEGAEQLLFSAHVSGIGSSSNYGLFLFDLASGTTQSLTPGSFHQDPQTDNVRIAWASTLRDWTPGQPFDLLVAPLANPTADVRIGASVSGFMLRDGLLAWTELNSDRTAELKVDDGASTIEITPSASSGMFLAQGRVTFQENGKVHVWQSGAGRRVVLNSLPTQSLRHHDGIGFFTKGGTPSQTLYRIELP